MTAKMRSKPYRRESRPDWDEVRVQVMRWCLRVKLAQNPRFGELLRKTGDRPIVEESARDAFWGALPRGEETLTGRNILGRLLMELREELGSDTRASETVEPPPLPEFVLLGSRIQAVHAIDAPAKAAASLFDQVTTEEAPRKETRSADTIRVGSPLDETPVKTRKKLIEVALPLEAVNEASVREGYIYRGNPSALHKWWAQRPMAAARAVIFAQMVDDPSAWPERFPTEEEQIKERTRLFRIIEELVKWENTTNEDVIEAAREEIRRCWRDACEENSDHPLAAELFKTERLPGFNDPFAGAGTLPLEAQRLGLSPWASDLNPVAVLLAKAMIEIPPKFANRSPVGPLPPGEKEQIPVGGWTGAEGLAEDVRRYGAWIRAEAEERIGHLYPKVKVTEEMAHERPDLELYVGHELTVIAWLWARTVKSPNPAFADVDVPLISTFMLSTKKGKEAYVVPVIEDRGYRFSVEVGAPTDLEAAKAGTKLSRGANFRCLMSGVPIPGRHIKTEGRAGRLEARMMAIVAETDRGRVYLPPSEAMEETARQATPDFRPDLTLSGSTQYLGVKPYGIDRVDQLFTDRQLVALTVLSDLVREASEHVRSDAVAAGMSPDDRSFAEGGIGGTAYADAVATLLAFGVDKTAEYGCTIVPWYAKEDRPKGLFARQAIPMVWDFAEVNPLADIGGTMAASLGIIAGALSGCAANGEPAMVRQLDAVEQTLPDGLRAVISTDPPYYDNVPYADLSDFFYPWLRRSLRSVYPDVLSTVAAPKSQELVAFAYRHSGKSEAEEFFLEGMTRAMHRLKEQQHPAFPMTIYYAFKQTERDADGVASNTGWETFLGAVLHAGLDTTGTWPLRTERGTRSRGIGSNALASSVVLVCRPSSDEAGIATRRDFIHALRRELPEALRQLQRANIAPVDLAQSAIGPGMAIYTRYARVLDPDGSPLSVHDALTLVNQTLDEVLAEQEGELDSDTRWAVAWFEQSGFAEGEFGVAEVLSKAKGTSVDGMVRAGIVEAGRGKVRLLRPDELSEDWDPVSDQRLTVWEATHHLVRRLDDGEYAAAELARQLGGYADAARDLAYRLFVICERKKRAQEALAYNGLVQSWPEIQRLAAESPLQQQMEV
jgi:putative DNA methylase